MHSLDYLERTILGSCETKSVPPSCYRVGCVTMAREEETARSVLAELLAELLCGGIAGRHLARPFCTFGLDCLCFWQCIVEWVQ